VFLAALAEHVAARDRHPAPAWTKERVLRQFWFPFNPRSARADAIVHAPAAFRRRGVYVSPQGAGGRVSEADPLLDRAAIQDAPCTPGLTPQPVIRGAFSR
jgi:hypothetical protein